MAINVGDAVLKIKGDTKDLDQALQKSQGKVQSAMQKMQKSLRMTGIAFTAVGVAGLKMVDSARKMNAQLGVTALNLGITTKEMRNLALETTNVTFPLKEVTASFDLLARAGVKNKKVMKDVATAFDTLGDATGYSASQVTSYMVPAMKTFGLTATEMAKKTDLMTYMSRKSTMSMEDFNTMVGYTTPELVKAGLTMEDLTAALIYMERQGYAPGRVMTREFMKATTKATKEQIPLTEALGMTSEELAGYKEELKGATGMTEEFAEVANKQYGIMDKLKQKFDELALSAGSFLTPLEPILVAMTALGPLMIGLSMVKIPSMTKALIALKAITIALVAELALLAAGLAMIGWAAIKLKKQSDQRKVLLKVLEGEERTLKDSKSAWRAAGEEIEGTARISADYYRQMSYEQLQEEFHTKLLENKRLAMEGLDNQYLELLEVAQKVGYELDEETLSWMAASKAAEFAAQAKKLATEATEEFTEATEESTEALDANLDRIRAVRRELMSFARKVGLETYMAVRKQMIIEKVYMPERAEALQGYQHGGPILGPTLLTSLKTMQPYAIAGERGREVVSPAGGYKTANIIVSLDGKVLAQAIGEPLVEEIRLRTGARY